MKIKTEQVIEVSDWDQLVTETYGRPYSFQQQDGCQDRGYFHLTVPDKAEDFTNESIPETEDELMFEDEDTLGVSFATWLARDPKQPLVDQKYDFELMHWWDRNFYPNIQMVANDLHAKGLLPAGDYSINIDW